MAEQISLTNLANLQNENTAVTAINNNNTSITSAFADVLSRSGVLPNSMESALDMNANRIINLTDPISGTEPVTVAYLDDRLTDLEIASGLTGVPVSSFMQPVVNSADAKTAQRLMGIGSGVTPQMYGALGDGTTNDTTAINNAIAYCNANNVPLIFPAGSYRAMGPLTTINGAVDVIGAGNRATTLLVANATNDFIVHSGTGTIRDLCIDYYSSTIKTSGAHIKITGNGVSVQRVWSRHAYLGIHNTGRINRIENCNVESMTSRAIAADSGGILNEGGILNILSTSVSGATLVAADCPEYCYKGLATGLGGEIDMTNCYGLLANYGLIATSSATGPFNGLMATNCWFDSELTCGILIDSTPGFGNSPCWLTNCWASAGYGATASPVGIWFKGASTGDAQLVNCRPYNYNGGTGTGIWINGSGQKNIHCVNTMIGGTGTGFSTGFLSDNSATNWSLIGGHVRGSTTGISIGATNNNYTILGVDCADCSSATINNFSPAATSRKVGFNPNVDIISASSVIVRNAAGTGTTTITYDQEGRITGIS